MFRQASCRGGRSTPPAAPLSSASSEPLRSRLLDVRGVSPVTPCHVIIFHSSVSRPTPAQGRGERRSAEPPPMHCEGARGGEGRLAGCYVINPSSGEAISPQLRHRLVRTAPPCTCVSALYVTRCAFAPLTWHPRNVAKLLFCFLKLYLIIFWGGQANRTVQKN